MANDRRSQSNQPPQYGASPAPSSSNIDDILGPVPEHLRDINVRLARAREAGWHVIAPTAIRSLSGMCRVVFEELQFSSEFAKGQVYPQGGKLSFSRTSLMRFASALGLEYEGAQRIDDGEDPMVVTYKAKGRILTVDGLFRPLEADYTFDVRERLEEMRLQMERDSSIEEAKRRNNERYDALKIRSPAQIARKLDEERAGYMKNRTQRAETGAHERLVGLIVPRGGYTSDDLTKPFLIMRVVIDIAAHPDGARMLLQSMLRFNGDLYGSRTPSADLGLTTMPPMAMTVPLIPPVSAPPPAVPPMAPAPPVPPVSPPQPMPPMPQTIPQPMAPAMSAEEFSFLDEEAQLTVLRALVLRKPYDIAALKKPLGEFSPKDRLGFYVHLAKLPDKVLPPPPPPEDEIDFSLGNQ